MAPRAGTATYRSFRPGVARGVPSRGCRRNVMTGFLQRRSGGLAKCEIFGDGLGNKEANGDADNRR